MTQTHHVFSYYVVWHDAKGEQAAEYPNLAEALEYHQHLCALPETLSCEIRGLFTMNDGTHRVVLEQYQKAEEKLFEVVAEIVRDYPTDQLTSKQGYFLPMDLLLRLEVAYRRTQ